MALTGESRAASPKTLQRMGRIRYPPYDTSATYKGIFGLWSTTCIRRMELNNWELSPRREPPPAFEGQLHLYWDIAARNINKVRRRTLRSELVTDDVEKGPIALDAGAILRVPPDGEAAPGPPAGAEALYPLSGCFESSSDSDVAPGHSGPNSGSHTPRWVRGNPGAPPPQRPRADS